jgi:hypothetical protein
MLNKAANNSVTSYIRNQGAGNVGILNYGTYSAVDFSGSVNFGTGTITQSGYGNYMTITGRFNAGEYNKQYGDYIQFNGTSNENYFIFLDSQGCYGGLNYFGGDDTQTMYGGSPTNPASWAIKVGTETPSLGHQDFTIDPTQNGNAGNLKVTTSIKAPNMPTADPADGTGTLYYDPITRLIKMGT